jgi:hypothetical protein
MLNKIILLLCILFISQSSFISKLETPYDCIQANCPSQAAACDDTCTNILYTCLDKCSSNSCATLCVAGTGNINAVNVLNCGLQKGCSPYPNFEMK